MLPGLDPRRLVRLIAETVAECALDLSGYTVMTEAASGAYVVTPIVAAVAGAREVIAVTRTTRYGSAEDIERNTMALAELAGVAGTVSIVRSKIASLIAKADIVTNSGHLRPLDAETIRCMKPGAVVPLMFEAWELLPDRFDVDLAELRARGIPTAGTNERHPLIDVFSYLGPMAAKLLLEAAIPPLKSRIAILCDNPFAGYLAGGLEKAGAVVSVVAEFASLPGLPTPDVVLVAQLPRSSPAIGSEEAVWLSQHWPGTTVVQYWGEIDRQTLTSLGVPFWPRIGPSPRHMAVLPSDVGPEPIVRLQVGGLKVAQVLLKPVALRSPADMAYVDSL